MKSLEILDFNVFFFGYILVLHLHRYWLFLICGHESETKTMEFKLYNFFIFSDAFVHCKNAFLVMSLNQYQSNYICTSG